MSAVTYHVDCDPQDGSDYARFKSKYDGNCTACGGEFSKGDSILYFNPSRGEKKEKRTGGSSAAPAQVTELEKKVAELEKRFNQFSVDVSAQLVQLDSFAIATRKMVISAQQPEAF